MRTKRTSRRRRGFSLLEGLLASAVLAFASAALLLPFSVGAANNALVVDQAAAVNLSEALMEEILAKPFYDPNSATRVGPETGESRTSFDNIDDYGGYTETAGNMTDAAGARIADPSLQSFYRTVTVTYVAWPGQNIAATGPTAIRVVVQVRANGQTVFTLTRLVGRRNELPMAGGVILN
jgi:MSHA pilin protein MshD